MSEESKKEKEKDIFKSKFEGIFLISQIGDLLNEYKELIQTLNKISEANNLKDFDLNPNIIKMIFGKYDTTINFCKVKNSFAYFTIDLNFQFQKISRYKKINLKRTEYKFSYKNKDYYCFTMDSMKKYLDDLLEEHEYYIELTSQPYSGKKIKDIEQFLMLNSSDFKILIDYQFRDIDYNTFNYDFYNLPDKITGKNLNLKLGHYVSLTEEEYKDFIYYDTEERKKFYKGFQQILYLKKVFGICGPYGTGKTIMMLKMIISDKSQKYLYINLGTVNDLNNNELKKLLRYEIIKLFDKEVIFLEDKSIPEKQTYDKIINLIDNLKNKQIFSLLKNIIILMNNLQYTNSYFIIDQYSSKYDFNNNNIKELIETIKKKKNIHIIICSSMNNEDVKYNLSECLNEKAVFPSYNIDFIYYFYVGSLIRLNNLSNYETLIETKSQEFKTYLYYFGNLPLYYYLLERAELERGELKNFIYKEKKEIKNEIKLYYKGNIKNRYEESYQMIYDILNIMSLINKREIFFFDELSSTVAKYPLKFLEIKKEKIKINELKLFGLASNNQKIKNYTEDLESIEPKDSKSKIRTNQFILENYVMFFNEDKYCFNYISKLTEKEKNKLGFIESNINPEITIFYLDYLFPFIEEIFSNIIYDILSISSKYIFELLPAQSKGGLLELIISEKVKNSKKCLLYNISDCETVENFVPNAFFIQNYITRKINTLRTFIENKNQKLYKKKKLTGDYIFFTQLQFTGKYYDCALLVPCKDGSGYKLMLLQISKRKITSQRFFREEHMIILNRVKSKLEKEYDIIIKEGHFSYILTYEDPDKDIIEFCKDYNLNYFLFSIDNLSFMNLEDIHIIFTEKTLITKQFPFQSSFSILPENKFTMKNKKLNDYEYIKKFQKELIFEDIEEELKNLINKYFENNQELAEDDKNEFYLFGNFDEIVEVNNLFCIWFNNNDYSLYYKNNNKYEIFDLKYPKKLSNKNFSLICSKYSIKKRN